MLLSQSTFEHNLLSVIFLNKERLMSYLQYTSSLIDTFVYRFDIGSGTVKQICLDFAFPFSYCNILQNMTDNSPKKLIVCRCSTKLTTWGHYSSDSVWRLKHGIFSLQASHHALANANLFSILLSHCTDFCVYQWSYVNVIKSTKCQRR